MPLLENGSKPRQVMAAAVPEALDRVPPPLQIPHSC
jgi:hypothetical protein